MRATAAVNEHIHNDEAKSNITSKQNDKSEQTHFGESVFNYFFSQFRENVKRNLLFGYKHTKY